MSIDGVLEMFELDQGIADQLTEVSLNSSVQVRCGNSDSFMVTASTLIPLLQMFEMKGVYISASRGAAEVIQAFESVGIDVSQIQFIDLVSSGILGGTMYLTIISISLTVQSCLNRYYSNLIHSSN